MILVTLQVDRSTDITWDVTYIIWAEYLVCDIPCAHEVDTYLDITHGIPHYCGMIGMSIGLRISHGMSHISYGLSTQYVISYVTSSILYDTHMLYILYIIAYIIYTLHMHIYNI